MVLFTRLYHRKCFEGEFKKKSPAGERGLLLSADRGSAISFELHSILYSRRFPCQD
jgi:hypothetical protein